MGSSSEALPDGGLLLDDSTTHSAARPQSNRILLCRVVSPLLPGQSNNDYSVGLGPQSAATISEATQALPLNQRNTHDLPSLHASNHRIPQIPPVMHQRADPAACNAFSVHAWIRKCLTQSEISITIGRLYQTQSLLRLSHAACLRIVGVARGFGEPRVSSATNHSTLEISPLAGAAAF
ncbi:hypothetical protein CTA1_3450 [Colletotrichum tanaceti]|uniref:Uncharacterized protein n=1 Tax=Colletotrichum tanaceti TaxID=1306861 RepID=A0A4U6X7N6_9PEZI|nr:hypothetical protein CTA1_3450 [Colletotrichum tanaceti]